jgi:hypothetical protein
MWFSLIFWTRYASGKENIRGAAPSGLCLREQFTSRLAAKAAHVALLKFRILVERIADAAALNPCDWPCDGTKNREGIMTGRDIINFGSAGLVLSIALTGAVAGQSPGSARPAPGEPDQNTPAATALEAAPVLTAPPCDTPQHHQFDFWLGEWQVFDAVTNELVAFDRIEKLYEGCIVQQSMNFVTDLYRRPGATYRLAGISINRYDGEGWMEMWADNQWGAIALRGSPDTTAAMVLRTVTPSRNRDLKIVWEKHADGSVRILQYVAPAGSGKWQKYGDLIYRRNR